MPYGVASAAHSAIVQQFLHGRSDSLPSPDKQLNLIQQCRLLPG
ncbi:hypothetical protein ACH4ND_30015 [Streptomyces sp. NPDC017179]